MKCRKCGTVFDVKYGVCPKCGTIYESVDVPRGNHKTIKEDTKKVKVYTGTKKTTSSTKKGDGIKGYVIGVAFAGVLILGIVVALVIKAVSGGGWIGSGGGESELHEKTEELANVAEGSQDTGNSENDLDNGSEDSISDRTEQSADAYFAEKAKVISVSSVEESNIVISERDTVQIMKERGFLPEEVTTDYSIRGEYLGDNVKISENSDTTHPVYQLEYMNSAGEFWMVLLTGNAIIANPLSYNLGSDLGVMVVVSEKESVISYDSIENRFFETIPKKTEVIVLQRNRIDSTLLDKLTIEEIDRSVR